MEIIQGEIGYEITTKSLQGKESVMINSPGGSLFEGLAMYDYVKATDIEIGVIGLCASAATLPLIASSKRWGTPNSRYLIHNPSQSFFFDSLTADELKKTADELKAEQDRALNRYFDVLNKSKEEIQVLMDEDRIMTAEEALEWGLITEIRNIEQDIQPVENNTAKNIYNKFKMQINSKQMEKDEIKKELTGIRLLFDKLMKSLRPVKMIVLQDVNGVELDFGSIQTEEEIIIGVSATVNGDPANGEYVMPSGETYIFTDGVLTAINPAASPDDSKLVEENAQLKQDNENLSVENEILKEEIEMMKKAKIEMEKTVKLLDSKIKNFENNFTEEKPKEVIPPTEPEQKSGFKYKSQIFKN